ncbi:MAG: phosphodiesterase [Acidobacteria bacterium]|nr:phosphodiesterase [Acidobacteriota bacterium]
MPNDTQCFFVSDLHGRQAHYRKLFDAIKDWQPSLVFLGGDLLPATFSSPQTTEHQQFDFIDHLLCSGFDEVRKSLGAKYPRVYLILGNDDLRSDEARICEGARDGLWEYIHESQVQFQEYSIWGYSYVPPTPFILKDWERYDVSRHLDPGCIHPEEGWHSQPPVPSDLKYKTISKDLEALAGASNMEKAIFLFHTPPYQTNLDRVANDGKMIDHVPLDLHIGSIAVRRFIESRQPYITLHGHVHESARIMGSWKDRIGRTFMLSAAHDGPELALIRFSLETPEAAVRDLL